MDDYSIQYFENTLNSMGIQGIKRKYWLKIYHKNPKKAGRLFFEKLDREFKDQKSWELAKYFLLKKYPHWGPEPKIEPKIEPEPEPITYNLEYFLRINGGRWGCAMVDIDDYEREYGVVI